MPASMFNFLIWAQVGGPGGMRPGQGIPQGVSGPGAGAILAGLLIPFLFFLLVGGFFVAVMWKIYTKAGEPGWAAIVPVYNFMILSKICGRGEMFGLLMLVPCVGIVVSIMLVFDLARVFGKDTGFAIGMLLLGIVFYPMLAFGNAEYLGPDADTGTRRRRRRDEEEDDDEEERPRRRRIVEEEDERPRRPAAQDERVKRRPPIEERPKRRPVDEDNDEEDPPRRRGR